MGRARATLKKAGKGQKSGFHRKPGPRAIFVRAPKIEVAGRAGHLYVSWIKVNFWKRIG